MAILLKKGTSPHVSARELQGPDACGCPFSFRDISSLNNDSTGLCFLSHTVNILLMSLFAPMNIGILGEGNCTLILVSAVRWSQLLVSKYGLRL